MGDLNTNYKKPTTTLLLASLLLVTGVTAGGLYALNRRDMADPKAEEVIAASNVQPEVKAATTVRFTAINGKTVLEQLRNREKVVVEQDPQDGSIVESINGIKNGTGNKYWSFYVDGQIPNKGAGKYITKGGEEIVWKFE